MGCCGSQNLSSNSINQTAQHQHNINQNVHHDTESVIESKFKQIFVDSNNLKIGDKIRVGSISEIYDGKLLLESGTSIDVLCKGIKKEIICKYNLFVYILREILIGMCANNDCSIIYYGITYNKQLKTIFIIMEKYGSVNLGEYIWLNTLTTGKKIEFAISTLKIIEQLHSENIVHRDIKLVNFLIKDDNIKICDFGTAVINRSVLNSMCGTLTHMAPEIMTCDNYDYTVDYWSYAIMLIELFTTTENIDLIAINNLIVKSNDTSYPILAHYIDNENIIQIVEYIINNYKQKKCIDIKYIYYLFQQIIVSMLNCPPKNICADDQHNDLTSPITDSTNKFASFLEKLTAYDINTVERIIYNRSSDCEQILADCTLSPITEHGAPLL